MSKIVELLGKIHKIRAGLCRENIPESLLDRIENLAQVLESGPNTVDQKSSTTELFPITQDLVASICRRANESVDSVGDTSEQFLSLTEITKDDLPRLSPT